MGKSRNLLPCTAENRDVTPLRHPEPRPAKTKKYRRLPPETRMTWPHPYVADLIEVERPTPQLSLI